MRTSIMEQWQGILRFKCAWTITINAKKSIKTWNLDSFFIWQTNECLLGMKKSTLFLTIFYNCFFDKFILTNISSIQSYSNSHALFPQPIPTHNMYFKDFLKCKQVIPHYRVSNQWGNCQLSQYSCKWTTYIAIKYLNE